MPSYNYVAPTTNTSGTERGNALTIFGGAILMNFRRTTLFWDIRGEFASIKTDFAKAKAAVWPVLGSDPDAEHHVPGDELLGQQQPFDQVSISIDDYIVGHRFIPGDDDIVAHFSAQEPYAGAIGRQLGNSADDKLARTLVIAARTSASTGFHQGGNVVNRVGAGTTIADAYPSSATGAANFRSDMRTLAYQMDVDEVPLNGRKIALTPYIKQVLQYDTTVFSRDYQDYTAAGGNLAMERRIGKCEGFDLYVSNQSIPNEAFYAPRGPRFDPTKYDVNTLYQAGNVAASTGQPVALAFCGAMDGNAAVGLLQAENFYTNVEYLPRRGGTFMMGRNFLGVGKLAVWCAGIIQGQLS